MTDNKPDELIAIFTDKYVYNEGDVMKIKGVLRHRTGVGQVILQIVNIADGKTVFTGKYPLVKDSDFTTTWKIQGPLLKPDTYQIFASVGNNQISTTFEYREPGMDNVPMPKETRQRQRRGMLDPRYSPQYYIERYGRDPLFREWFEKTYPGKTINEVAGLEETEEPQPPVQPKYKPQEQYSSPQFEKEEYQEPQYEEPKKQVDAITPEKLINRYHTESAFKERFDSNYPNITIEKAVGVMQKPEIPQWVKNIFRSYGDGRVSDLELIDTIRFLINEGIVRL